MDEPTATEPHTDEQHHTEKPSTFMAETENRITEENNQTRGRGDTATKEQEPIQARKTPIRPRRERRRPEYSKDYVTSI